MIKINWDSFIKERVWFGWLWHEGGRVKKRDGSYAQIWSGEWRRISTYLRFVPVQMAWPWRGGWMGV